MDQCVNAPGTTTLEDAVMFIAMVTQLLVCWVHVGGAMDSGIALHACVFRVLNRLWL